MKKPERKTILEKMVEDGLSTREIMENKECWDWIILTKEDRPYIRYLDIEEEN